MSTTVGPFHLPRYRSAKALPALRSPARLPTVTQIQVALSGNTIRQARRCDGLEIPLSLQRSTMVPMQFQWIRAAVALALVASMNACQPAAAPETGSGEVAMPGSGAPAAVTAAGSGSGAGTTATVNSTAALDSTPALLPVVDACARVGQMVRGAVDPLEGIASSDELQLLQTRLMTATGPGRVQLLEEIGEAGTAAEPLADLVLQGITGADPSLVAASYRTLRQISPERLLERAREDLSAPGVDEMRRRVAAGELARVGEAGLQTLMTVIRAGGESAQVATDAVYRAAVYPGAAREVLFSAQGVCSSLAFESCRTLARELLPIYPDLLENQASSTEAVTAVIARLLLAEEAARTSLALPEGWLAAAQDPAMPTSVIGESLAALVPQADPTPMVPLVVRLVGDASVSGLHREVAARWLQSAAMSLSEQAATLANTAIVDTNDTVAAVLGLSIASTPGDFRAPAALLARLEQIATSGTRDRSRQAALAFRALGGNTTAVDAHWMSDDAWRQTVSILDAPDVDSLVATVNASSLPVFQLLDALQVRLGRSPADVSALWAHADVSASRPVWAELAARSGESAAAAASRLVPTNTWLSPQAAVWLAAQGQQDALRALVASTVTSDETSVSTVGLQLAERLREPVSDVRLRELILFPKPMQSMDPAAMRDSAARLWASQGGPDASVVVELAEALRETGVGQQAIATLAANALNRCTP